MQRMRRVADVTAAVALATGVAILLATGAVAAPELGEVVGNDALAGRDIGIGPDGANLPPGRGSALDGVDLYVEKCAACHGLRGEGGSGPALAGGFGTLATNKPLKTVGSYWPYATTLFDYIRRAMPYDRPMSLTDDETYALTAYVLWANQIVTRDTVLDARSLPRVKMPNRDGFIDAWETKQQ
jgi:cytochrome c